MLIKGIHRETQIDSVNDPSGLYGLSFCPLHRNCPRYFTRRSKPSNDLDSMLNRYSDLDQIQGSKRKSSQVVKQKNRELNRMSVPISDADKSFEAMRRGGDLSFKEQQKNVFLLNQKAVTEMFHLECYFPAGQDQILAASSRLMESPSKRTQLLFALSPFVMNCCFSVESGNVQSRVNPQHRSTQQLSPDQVFEAASEGKLEDHSGASGSLSTLAAKDLKKKLKDRLPTLEDWQLKAIEEQQANNQNGLLNWHWQAYSYDNSKLSKGRKEYSELLMLIDLCRIKLTQYDQDRKLIGSRAPRFKNLIYKYVAYQPQVDVKPVFSAQNYQRIVTVNETDRAKIDQLLQEIKNYDYDGAEGVATAELREALLGAYIDLAVSQRHNLYKIIAKFLLVVKIQGVNALYLPGKQLKRLI